MKAIQHFALASLCLSASFSVLASTCDLDYSSYSSGFGYSVVPSDPECFAGSLNNAQVQLNATSGRQWQAISNALAWRDNLSGPALAQQANYRGMAAGEGSGAWNLWANVLRDETEQHYTNVFDEQVKHDSDVDNNIFGADYALSPELVLGVSAAVDNGDIRGSNSTSPGDRNELSTEGFLIAPYLGWQISNELALDVSLGMGQGEFEFDTDHSSQDSDRWYFGTNLAYERWLDNWQFTGKAGYLHAEEDYEDLDTPIGNIDNSGSTNEIDQLQLGGQVGYWLQGFMPYAGLKYVNDLDRSSDLDGTSHNPIGRDAWIWTLGLNYYSLPYGITAGIAYEQEDSRSNQDRDALMANFSLSL